MLNRLSVALFVAGLLGVELGRAQSASDASPAQVRAAADAFDRGREAYKSGDPVVAAEAFELADSKAASPVALEYAIRSRDKAGQLDRAGTLAALARRRYPDEAALSKLADDVLAKARTRLYELSVTCSEACELVVDGKLVYGAASSERTVFLEEGERTVRAGFSRNRSDSRTIDATRGANGYATLDAPRAEAGTDEPEDEALSETSPLPPPEPALAVVEPPPSAPESSGWSPAVFWVGTGITAVLGGVTLWSGLDTVKNPGEERVQEACRNDEPNCESLYEDGRKRQDRTNVLLGMTGAVGLATILIGAAATDWGDESGSSEPVARVRRVRRSGARLTPWVALGDGAVLGAEGRF
jgi:hypothetical protein